MADFDDDGDQDIYISLGGAFSGDFELLRTSHPVVRRQGNSLRFEVPVAAGRTAALRYTVRLRW